MCETVVHWLSEVKARHLCSILYLTVKEGINNFYGLVVKSAWGGGEGEVDAMSAKVGVFFSNILCMTFYCGLTS